MIVPGPSGIRILLRHLVRPVAVLFAFDMAVAIAYVYGNCKWLSAPDIPLSMLGGAIGVIVGFRNNSSYQRWWEARTLWGSIVNNSRTLGRQILSMIAAPETAGSTDVQAADGVCRDLVRLQIAYVHALRCHLRGQAPWNEMAAILPDSDIAALRAHSNVPVAIQQKMAWLLSECFKHGWIDNVRWSSIEQTMAALTNAQGGAERIRNTPMPRQYDLFPRIFVGVYCLLLPFGIVSSLGMLTPVGSSLVGLIFLALDEVGRDLESPFANTEFDVPLTAITRTIEIDLRQLIDDVHVPPPEKPVHGVLW